MTLFLLTVAIVSLSMLGLGLGVLLGRDPLHGCGGAGCEGCAHAACPRAGASRPAGEA